MHIRYEVETYSYISNWEGFHQLELARNEAREYVYGMGGEAILREYRNDKLFKITVFESDGGDGEQSTDEVVTERVIYLIRRIGG